VSALRDKLLPAHEEMTDGDICGCSMCSDPVYERARGSRRSSPAPVDPRTPQRSEFPAYSSIGVEGFLLGNASTAPVLTVCRLS